MNGYEKRTQAKKESILRAARTLFAERGVSEVGVGEIAAQAGVSQVSIYNYFGAKDCLVREVLLSYLEKAMHTYEEILEQDLPFVEKLHQMLIQKQNTIIEISRAQFSRSAWEDKTLQRLFREAAREKAVSIYLRFIEQGKKEGVIDEKLPNEAIIAYMTASMAIIQSPEYLSTPAEYKLAIIHLFLYGLLKEK